MRPQRQAVFTNFSSRPWGHLIGRRCRVCRVLRQSQVLFDEYTVCCCNLCRTGVARNIRSQVTVQSDSNNTPWPLRPRVVDYLRALRPWATAFAFETNTRSVGSFLRGVLHEVCAGCARCHVCLLALVAFLPPVCSPGPPSLRLQAGAFMLLPTSCSGIARLDGDLEKTSGDKDTLSFVCGSALVLVLTGAFRPMKLLEVTYKLK